MAPGFHNLTIVIGEPEAKLSPFRGLQRIDADESRLSPGRSISWWICSRSTRHRHNGGAGEQQNSVGGPLFGSLSKTVSSVAREACPRPAAVSRRVLAPNLTPIARRLGGDLETGLNPSARGLRPGSRTAAPMSPRRRLGRSRRTHRSETGLSGREPSLFQPPAPPRLRRSTDLLDKPAPIT